MSPETFLGLSLIDSDPMFYTTKDMLKEALPDAALIELTPDALTIVYPGTYTFTLERTGFQDDEGKDMQRMATNG